MRPCKVDPSAAFTNSGLAPPVKPRGGEGKDRWNFVRRRIELPIAETLQVLRPLDLQPSEVIVYGELPDLIDCEIADIALAAALRRKPAIKEQDADDPELIIKV